MKKEVERKAKFKPSGSKLDWTNKGVQEIFADFLFKTLLFNQEIYEDCSLGNVIKENRELYTFLTKGVDQFENMIFQGSSEEGLTIYNMTESNLERDKSDPVTICNFDLDIMHVLDKEVVHEEDFRKIYIRLFNEEIDKK